jgi:hypothetical protein
MMRLSCRCAGLALLWGLVLLATPVRADLGGFYIARFDVILEVEPDADLVVTERIEVRFAEPRRGIYREIPISYTDPVGYQYGYGFRLLSVTDERGDARPVKLSREGAVVRLRIGDPDRLVSQTQVYVVRYRARDVLRQFPDHDELYWNVTGHRWNVRIDEASVVVRLPGDSESGELQVGAWSGPWGGRETDVDVGFPGPGEVEVRTTDRLESREGLTVAVAWPPGMVRFPGGVTRAWRFLSHNVIVLAPLLALIFLLRRYRSQGRDPGVPASVVVRYEPPEGVSAGGIGTLVDEQVDLADITATIVDLAVRGHLRIRTDVEEEFFGLKKTEVTSFTRNLEAPDADLLPHERLILDGLFAHDPVSVTTDDLKEEFYRHLPAIRTALYDRLVDKGFFAASPQSVRRRTMGLGVLAGAITAAVGLFLATMQGAIFPNAAVLPVGAALATTLLFFAFARAMPRRTPAGVRALAWARGFEEFAGRVEGDRLEREAARSTFEKLLPYAMALGVATKWSRKFEGIYAEQPPAWYVGPHPATRSFSTVSFHHSLESAMSTAGRSLAASPRSSGSSGTGGGGFSGGGGGGGGGGSW